MPRTHPVTSPCCTWISRPSWKYRRKGPLGNAQATQRSSKTLLLVPGEDVLGDGILLEIHGFIITPLAPLPDAKVKAGSPFEVRATVTMACGCPTEPDGLWDANKIRVVARLLRDGKVESEIPMTYAGVQNTFHVDVPVTAAGPDGIASARPGSGERQFRDDSGSHRHRSVVAAA